MSTAELIGQAVVWKVVSTLALIAFLAAVAVIAGVVENRGRAVSDANDADVASSMRLQDYRE